MNDFFNNLANRTGHKFPLSALMLTFSASALGHAPSAPTIDWMEVHDNQAGAADFADVHVGWSHYDLGPVTSVQYRVDGMPLMSHKVRDGQFFGEAEIPLHANGEFDFTVALCNAHGCGETPPFMLDVHNAKSGEWSMTESAPDRVDAEVKRELERIQANTQKLENYYALPESGLAPSASSYTWLIKAVAKAVLTEAASQGTGLVFDKLMDHLGLGEEPFDMQIDELQSSIGALNSKVDYLTAAIESMADQANWQGFLNQHKDANNAINLIYANFSYVAGWIEHGVEVDDFAWTTARKNIADSLTILAGAKLNANGGIVDSRDGAIYQLMTAIPQRVASVDSYWTLVDEYRDFYRASISMAFLGLDLIEDSFDGSGTTRVMAEDALKAGQRAVLAMYAYGVAPDLPDSLDFVQMRGSVEGFGSREFGGWDDSVTIQYQAWWLRNALGHMATQYRPEHHDGLTMEEFLVESAVPTTYVLENTGGWKGTGWQVVKVDEGAPHLGIAPSYVLKMLVGQVIESTWQESYESFCQGGLCPFPVYAWNESQIQAAISEIKAEIRSRGGYRLIDGTFAQSHYGMIDLTDRLNHAGRMADFDPDAVRQAAFGDGAAILPRGVLPGSESGNVCLLAQSANLLQAGDFRLNWQPDGNLVLRENGQALWSSGTQKRADKLCWQNDGNLVIRLDGSGQAVWATGTADAQQGGFGGEQLKLLPNGTLQIVNEMEDVIWQAGPFD